VTLVARLVPIKRVDRFLQVANLLRDVSDVTFMIVGVGEMSDELRASAEAKSFGSRLVWTGFVETCRTCTSQALSWFRRLTTRGLPSP
jgi:glycosyltransferase involved in cell wall biosynthesis